MATISITQGGIDTRLTNRPTDSAPRPAEAVAPHPRTPSGAESAPAAPPPPTPLEMSQMAAEMQETLNAASQEPLSVAFREDERSSGFVIEIRNEAGDVVRQFPPEKVLNLRGRLDELSGMVIDEMT